MEKEHDKNIRNFVARDQLRQRRSKKFADRRERRAKDSKKSWKNKEEQEP
jgi:hypothetical protein